MKTFAELGVTVDVPDSFLIVVAPPGISEDAKAYYVDLLKKTTETDDWKKFFTNAGTLPVDSTSSFIRSSFNGMGPQSAQYFASMMRSQQLRASMLDQLQLFRDGKILSYYDILNTSR